MGEAFVCTLQGVPLPAVAWQRSSGWVCGGLILALRAHGHPVRGYPHGCLPCPAGSADLSTQSAGQGLTGHRGPQKWAAQTAAALGRPLLGPSSSPALYFLAQCSEASGPRSAAAWWIQEGPQNCRSSPFPLSAQTGAAGGEGVPAAQDIAQSLGRAALHLELVTNPAWVETGCRGGSTGVTGHLPGPVSAQPLQRWSRRKSRELGSSLQCPGAGAWCGELMLLLGQRHGEAAAWGSQQVKASAGGTRAQSSPSLSGDRDLASQCLSQGQGPSPAPGSEQAGAPRVRCKATALLQVEDRPLGAGRT